MGCMLKPQCTLLGEREAYYRVTGRSSSGCLDFHWTCTAPYSWHLVILTPQMKYLVSHCPGWPTRSERRLLNRWRLFRKNKAFATAVITPQLRLCKQNSVPAFTHLSQQGVGVWTWASTWHELTTGWSPQLLFVPGMTSPSQHTGRHQQTLAHVHLDFIPQPCTQPQCWAPGTNEQPENAFSQQTITWSELVWRSVESF